MSDIINRAITRRTFTLAAAATIALAMTAPPTFAATAPAKVVTKDVSVKTPDGTSDAVVFYPAKGKGPWPAVLFWPDLAGLRPAIRELGAKLAASGYVVLMPNAYYRTGPAALGEVNIGDPDVRKRQMAARATATDEGVTQDGIAYMAFLDAQKQTDTRKKAGTVGYDVGSSYAFRAAAAMPDRIAAVAGIHGLGVATERPNSPHLLVPKSKAAYFVVQSRDDDAREPGDKEDYKKVIAEAKLNGIVEVYPANHGFGIPGSANYDAASADNAWAGILTLLKTNLK